MGLMAASGGSTPCAEMAPCSSSMAPMAAGMPVPSPRAWSVEAIEKR